MSKSTAARVIYRYESELMTNVVLKKRYKRFLADVQFVPGETDITVYMPNTGSMLNLIPPQLHDPFCVLSIAPHGSKRKYLHSVEMIQVNRTYVGVHSALANKMVCNALQLGLIPECNGFSSMRQEVTVHEPGHQDRKQTKVKPMVKCKPMGSRIDFELLFERGPLLSPDKPSKKRKSSSLRNGAEVEVDISQRMLVEVKSVTLGPCVAQNGVHEQGLVGEEHQVLAEFPDSVSVRARKHAQCLTQHVREGGRAVLLFLLQRDDCNAFTLSSIDPAYKEAVQEAVAVGVLVLPYRCRLNPKDGTVELLGRVPFIE